MKSIDWPASLMIVFGFGIALTLDGWLKPDDLPAFLSFSFPYVIWSLTIFIVLLVLKKPVVHTLGLSASLPVGLAAAFVFSLPMLLGFASSMSFSSPTGYRLLTGALLPAFFEELLFRGFLVAGLMRLARWHFLPAALIGAFIFGLGHLFQGQSVQQALIVAVFTGIGGIWFAWLMVRWHFNLWLVIGLHCLMNGYWILWQVDSTAQGSNLANVFRMSTIVLSIAVTLWISRYRQHWLKNAVSVH